MKKTKVKKTLTEFVRYYALGLVRIGMILGLFALVAWMGWRGIVGFLVGVFIMSIVILTKNPVFMWFVDKTKSEAYLEDVAQVRKVEDDKRR